MPVSKKQQDCVARYVSRHYDQIKITVPKGTRPAIQSAAQAAGLSQNQYITQAVRERMERDGFPLPEKEETE